MNKGLLMLITICIFLFITTSSSALICRTSSINRTIYDYGNDTTIGNTSAEIIQAGIGTWINQTNLSSQLNKQENVSGNASVAHWAINVSGISCSLIDGGPDTDFCADDSSAGSGNTTEEVQDAVGTMVSGGLEENITVTYDDANNRFDFVVKLLTFNYDDLLDKPTKFGNTSNEILQAQINYWMNWTSYWLNLTTTLLNLNTSSVNASYFYGNGSGLTGVTATVSETDPQVDTTTANKWCAADATGTHIDCATEPVSDTNAGTLCAGDTTYLSGEGNCNDLAGIFWDSCDDATSCGWLTVEDDPQVDDIQMTKWCRGDALGTAVDCDVDPVVDTSAATECAGTNTYYDGEGNCDDLNYISTYFNATAQILQAGVMYWVNQTNLTAYIRENKGNTTSELVAAGYVNTTNLTAWVAANRGNTTAENFHAGYVNVTNLTAYVMANKGNTTSELVTAGYINLTNLSWYVANNKGNTTSELVIASFINLTNLTWYIQSVIFGAGYINKTNLTAEFRLYKGNTTSELVAAGFVNTTNFTSYLAMNRGNTTAENFHAGYVNVTNLTAYVATNKGNTTTELVNAGYINTTNLTSYTTNYFQTAGMLNITNINATSQVRLSGTTNSTGKMHLNITYYAGACIYFNGTALRMEAVCSR